MYLRTTARRNADGSVVRYLQLAAQRVGRSGGVADPGGICQVKRDTGVQFIWG